MPPEQVQVPPPVPSQHRNNKIIFSSILVTALVVGTIVGMRFLHPIESESPSTTEDYKLNGSVYSSNSRNITFTVPSGWEVSKKETVSLHPLFQNPRLVLKKINSECIIAEDQMWEKDPQEEPVVLKQISFGDRVFSDYIQFDGSWFVISSADTAEYEFSRTRQRLPGELRLTENSRQGNLFGLFMNDGSSVPDDCNEAFNVLLQTIKPYFETMSLASTSSGILTVEKVWDDVSSDTGTNDSYEHLVFQADNSTERKEIMKVPTGSYYNDVIVSGGKLYVISNSNGESSSISVVDPFTKQITEIPGTSMSKTDISSIFLVNGTLYYLANNILKSCSGVGPCSASLYSIPLAGGTPILVSSAPTNGKILGYVESEKALYIVQTWGDAGCFSASVHRIVGEKDETLGKFSECSSALEPDAYDTAWRKLEEAIESTKATRVSSGAIRVEQGAFGPAEAGLDGNRLYFDK